MGAWFMRLIQLAGLVLVLALAAGWLEGPGGGFGPGVGPGGGFGPGAGRGPGPQAENPRRPPPDRFAGDLWREETESWTDTPIGGRQPDMEPEDRQLFNGVIEAKPKTRSSVGSAFIVGRGGLWLTARHVSEGCAQTLLRAGPRKGVQARVAADNPRADVALLATKGGPAPLPVARRLDPDTRDAYMVGFPRGEPGVVHGRRLGTVRDRHVGAWNFTERVTSWTEVSRVPDRAGSLGGLSGGAVLDSRGRVIGVVQAELRRRGRVMTALPETIWQTIDRARHDIAAAPDDAAPDPELTPQTYPRAARRLIRGLRVAQVWCKV
ncbi:MAG: trypsin-like peptidase domain-containing protein [Hyphomicrobiales bacterium]|nr:trypsin-like peptidase domain-containing protein [Hyphomicrobiales bacterium]